MEVDSQETTQLFQPNSLKHPREKDVCLFLLLRWRWSYWIGGHVKCSEATGLSFITSTTPKENYSTATPVTQQSSPPTRLVNLGRRRCDSFSAEQQYHISEAEAQSKPRRQALNTENLAAFPNESHMDGPQEDENDAASNADFELAEKTKRRRS
jgi:hypothetical protein